MTIVNFLGVGVLLTALWVGAYFLNAFRDTELNTVDTRFEVRGWKKPPDDLVVVEVDADTFQDLNRRWPFPRRVHAKAVDDVVKDKPRVIAYDVQFTEFTSESDEFALLEAIDRARGKVVLATTEVNSKGQTKILGGDKVLEAGARAARQRRPLLRPGRHRAPGAVRGGQAEVARGRVSGGCDGPQGERRGLQGSGRHRLDRLLRPAGDDQERPVLARRPEQDAARVLQGQDRGDRPVRAVAPGRPSHVDFGRQADGGSRDPGQRARHGAARAAAAGGAALARRPADRGPRHGRSGCRPALLADPDDRRRRGRGGRVHASPRSSRSTTARSPRSCIRWAR